MYIYNRWSLNSWGVCWKAGIYINMYEEIKIISQAIMVNGQCFGWLNNDQDYVFGFDTNKLIQIRPLYYV